MSSVTSPTTVLKLEVGSLRQKDPIAPQMLAILRAAIVDLRLLPGEALSEKDIAGRFGVSRQPVREAFIKLEELGLVAIKPSRGTFVTKISVKDVVNARFVREAIESDIAAAAARLATKADISMLRGLVEDQRAAEAAADHGRFSESDEVFHHAIAQIVECDFAWRTVETARFHTDRVRLLSLPGASRLDTLIDQHTQIVDAIESGDADQSQLAMRRHLREILLALPLVAKTHPDYFSDTELPVHTPDREQEAARSATK